MFYFLFFGIVYGILYLYRFFVNFGIWVWFVLLLDVVGFFGGVCGVDNVWGVSGGVIVVVWLIIEVVVGWVDFRLVFAVFLIVLFFFG